MSLIVPMITRGALGRNDLLSNYGTTNFVQPPINDLSGLMMRTGGVGMTGMGMGAGLPGLGGGMMGSPMGGSLINQSSVGGFVAGAAVGAVAMNAMQNGGLNGNNSIDHPQNNYQNNGYNNQAQGGNFQSNGYNNQAQNGNFQGNGYNNQAQNGNFQNNGYNSQQGGNFQNNGYNNQQNGNFQGNGYNAQVQRSSDPLDAIFSQQPQNGGQTMQNNRQPVRGQSNFGVQQPVNTAPAAYASNPSQAQPVVRRNRVQPTGDRLSKGQKYSIKDRDGRPVNELKICFGWDIKDGRCELDASAFMLGDGGRVPSDDWFVFYGQPDSPDNGVHYKVFKDDPRSPDDAAIELDLNRVDQRVQKIAFAVTIYEASRNALHFGMVQNLYARILDRRTNREIASFRMDECYSTVTAMVLGELYRYKGEWKFNAVGSGVNKDLAEFCGMYGVALE